MDHQRLSQIETLWSVVRRAHNDQKDSLRSAQEEMLQRYGGAARRYLLGALRDSDAADEVYQEFALKFVRGDFRGADPERGRFRNLLKTVLTRTVIDHHRRKKRGPRADALDERLEPSGDDPQKERDRQFLQSWRDELLARAWAALKQIEQDTGKPMYTTLRLKVDSQDLRSPELAEQLSNRLGRNISPTNVRVMLHRAREQFADLLLDEVVHSLDNASPEALEQELADLRLLDYCRPATERFGDDKGTRAR